MANPEEALEIVLQSDVCGIHTKELLEAEIERCHGLVEALEKYCEQPAQKFDYDFFKRFLVLTMGYSLLLKLKYHGVADDQTKTNSPGSSDLADRLWRKSIVAPSLRSVKGQACSEPRQIFLTHQICLVQGLQVCFPTLRLCWATILAGITRLCRFCFIPYREKDLWELRIRRYHAEVLFLDPTRRRGYFMLASIQDDRSTHAKLCCFAQALIAKDRTVIKREEIVNAIQSWIRMSTQKHGIQNIRNPFITCHLAALSKNSQVFKVSSAYEGLNKFLHSNVKMGDDTFGQMGVNMAISLCAATLRYGYGEEADDGLINEFERNLAEYSRDRSKVPSLSLDSSEMGIMFTIRTVNLMLKYQLNPNVLPFMLIMIDFLHLLSCAGGATALAELLNFEKLALFLNGWLLETRTNLSLLQAKRVAFREHYQLRGTVCDQYDSGFYACRNPYEIVEPLYVEPRNERAKYMLQSAMKLCAVGENRSIVWLAVQDNRFYAKDREALGG